MAGDKGVRRLMPTFQPNFFVYGILYKSALLGSNIGLAIYFICRLLCPIVKLLKVVYFLE